MPTSEEDLRQAVDDALEPAWPEERRRAARRYFCSTLARVGVGLLGFFGLSLVAAFVTGAAFPWTFYVFIGALTTGAALHEARDPEHLRR